MKRIICAVGIFVATLSIAPGSAQADVGQRLVVDSVAALNVIGKKVDAINTTPRNNINALQEKISGLEDRLAANNRELAYLNDIHRNISPLVPKIKDTEVRDQLVQFLEMSFKNMPDDSILNYCKPKDVEKARRSENRAAEIQKLKEKATEKILKRAQKGDFSSGYTLGCVDYFLKGANNNRALLNSELSKAQEALEVEKGKLVKKPDSFTADAWLGIIGEADVPTKRIIDTTESSDNLTFQQLVDKYYSSKPYTAGGDFDIYMAAQDVASQREDFEKNGSANGKFDGLIKDKIGAFPAEITIQNYWQYDGGERVKGRFKVFDKVMVKSENGTVPAFEFPLGFKESFSEFGIPFVVTTMNSYWDESGKKRDGISIFCNYPESSDGKKTLMYNDGKTWKITIPDDAEFLTYNESLDRIKRNGHSPQILKLKETRDSYYGGSEQVQHSFLVVTNALIGHADNNYSDTSLILKYRDQENSPAASEGYCKIEVPGFNKIYVDNYSGMDYSGQVIIVEGSTGSGNNIKKKKYIYRPGLWEMNEEININGRNFSFCKDLTLIAEGTYNNRTGKWEIEEIAQGDF